jgi:hypothetical protein
MVLDDEGRGVGDPSGGEGLPVVESIRDEPRVEEHGDGLSRSMILVSSVPAHEMERELTHAEAWI